MTTTPASTPVSIIGAGLGGLSAAIRLAAAGHPVTIYEQGSQVGGKMNEIRADGFRWDTGPSVITMRHVLVDLFAAAGRNLDDYLALLPVDPLTRYFYQDGTVLDINRDLGRTTAQIEALEPRDVEGYLAYLAYAARLHRITGDVFIYGPPPTLASIGALLRKVPLTDALRVDALRSMQTAIGGFVRSPQLRQLLGRFATYVGASPFRAPATLNVIAHVELNGGVWYPKGGIYQIARAYEQLARELGVTIHTEAPVREIVLEGRRVTGLIMADGRTVPSRAVVANVDVATVYDRLLPPTLNRAKRAQLLNAETSCSGFILLLGVRGQTPTLAHHNIFFSADYQREFEEIFKQGTPPENPTIYVSITSKADPADAPEGCENWFVLVNAPPRGEAFDWTTNAERYAELILKRLATFAAGRFGVDLKGRIVAQRWLTPLDLEQLTGARRGALYGLSSNQPFTAFQRPHNRSQDVQGLYFAGGTTHPGGGVPMVTLSGKVAAEMLREDSTADKLTATP